MRKPYLNLIALILLPLAMAPHTRAQDRPFLSPDADTVPTGTLRVQAGLDFLEHVSYPLSGLEGDQRPMLASSISVWASPELSKSS